MTKEQIETLITILYEYLVYGKVMWSHEKYSFIAYELEMIELLPMGKNVQKCVKCGELPAAIGRALAHAGFGTQFTAEDESDNLADSPVERATNTPPRVVDKPADSIAKFTGAVTKIDVKLNAQNKPYIVAGGVTFHSCDAFRALAYEQAVIEKLAIAGVVNLPDGIVINYVLNEQGYKEPVSVKRLKTGEVVDMSELRSKASA